jgi:hypothetical protein
MSITGCLITGWSSSPRDKRGLAGLVAGRASADMMRVGGGNWLTEGHPSHDSTSPATLTFHGNLPHFPDGSAASN